MTSYPSGGTCAPAASEPDDDLDEMIATLGRPEPAPTPTPRPADAEVTPAAMAEWLHRCGYRVSEDKPRSKHAAKHRDDDKGHRDTLAAIVSAWSRTLDANVALRFGWQRGGKGAEPTFLVGLDADGPAANAWVRAQLNEAGILGKAPRCSRSSGGGAKYVLRVPYPVRTARLIVAGCRNAGHDGLELLSAGRKATVAPSIHPDGDPYIWDVPLPETPGDIPTCPDAILETERVETFVGNGTLAEDLIIRTSSGRSMTVAEWRAWMISTDTPKVGSCFIPDELRSGVADRKPTGFLGLKDASLMLHDSAGPATWWDGVRRVSGGATGGPGHHLDRETFTKVIDADLTVRKCRRRECRYADEHQKHYLDPHLLHDWWEQARMVAIRGPIGVGKTTVMASMLSDMSRKLGRPVKALVISHRKSLVTHSVEAFSLTTDYRGVTNWREMPIADLESLGICLDSLDRGASRKLRGRLTYFEKTDIKSLHWDVVVLDEAESVFRHLDTVRDSHRVYVALRSILRVHAGLTVLADAHLSDYSVGEYRRMVGEAGLGHWIDRPDGSKLRFAGKMDILVDDRRRRSALGAPDLFRLQVPEDVDATAMKLAVKAKPFYLHCTSRAEARRLQRKLRAQFPDKLWPLVTGEHDDPDGEAFLADPNGWITAHRGRIGAIVYTRAIESGVSITETLLDRDDIVVVKAGGEHSTWQDLVQAVGRPRRARWIFAHVAEHGRAPWWSADDYAAALAEGRAWTDQVLVGSKLVDGEVRQVPLDEEHAAFHVATVIHECENRRNLAEDWWGYWLAQGCSVQDLELLDEAGRKATREAATVERKALKFEDATALAMVANDHMTVANAEAILDRDGKPEERLAARRTLLEEFYEREATVDLALLDDQGRGRARVRTFTDIRLVAEGKMEQVAALDAGDAGKTSGRKLRLVAAVAVWDILRAVGVRRGHLDGTDTDGTLDAPDLVRLHEWLAAPATRRACKLALGMDTQGYLAGGRGRRKRRGTGGDDHDRKRPPVPLADDALTDEEFQALLDGTGGGDHDRKRPPVPSVLADDDSLDGVDWDALMAVKLTPAQVDEGRIRGHQLWAFAQQVARRVGLRFVSDQGRSGSSRGTRTRTLDMGSVAQTRL